MAIYRTGQASMDAQGYITGYGTKWREQLTLIRSGATIIFLSNPLQFGVITEVVSDTSMRAITTNGAVVQKVNYVIFLHDSLTVDGLAQDVAETLRYYQGKETEFAHFIEFLQGFDFAKLEDLTNQTKDAAAKAKTSETNAKASENAALASKNAAKTSETNAKTSETNAKNSETNAKNSENKAKEYADQASRIASPLTQYDWPVITGNENVYIKIAKLTDPGNNNSHLTLMVTNGGNYGSTHGNIDFIEISARGMTNMTTSNVANFLSIRRLGSPSLDDSNQMRYGLVKGDGFIEVWAFHRAFVNGAKVAILAQTARTELYIPTGFVKQSAMPSGYVESSPRRIYDQGNKPSKGDVGLGNVTNDAQVKKVGDTMTGDLEIVKGNPALYLKAPSGNAHLWFKNGDGSERGVIWATPNTASYGEVRIRAKNTAGVTDSEFIFDNAGKMTASGIQVNGKVSSRTVEVNNPDTATTATTIRVNGSQHTPIIFERPSYDSNLSIGFKLKDKNLKRLGVDKDGDLSYGEMEDQKQNSKVVTLKMLNADQTIGGAYIFSKKVKFSAGFAGEWEAVVVNGQELDLNSLMIKRSDPGSIRVYQCTSAGGGNNITNKPSGIGGNFILYVESIRKVSDTDFTNRQRLFGTDSNREFTRYCNNGSWSAWRESIVSGMNQDVSVKSMSASGRLSGGELAVGGAGSLNGNLGVGGGAASKVPSSDKGIVIGRGAMVREGGEGRLILSASGGTDRQVQLRPAGATASDNGIDISCTSASGGDTKIAFGQGAAIRCNASGSPIISAKAGQMMYLRPNGDAASGGQVTIAGNGNMVVDGEVVSKGFTASSGQITINNGGIELYHSSPYIDFHFNRSSADSTARIINDAADQLTLDCRSVRTMNDFTASGLIRACCNDAFVAWPYSDPSANIGQIRGAPRFQSRFNEVGGPARATWWLEEQVGTNHRIVFSLDGYGAETQYWQMLSDGRIWNSAKGDVSWAGTSDLRYKDNVVDYDGLQSLENIKAMNLIKFTYKDDDRKRERRGVAAQQIMEIDPCYVKNSGGSYIDENGEQVNIEKLVLDTNPLLMDALCAIKALSAQVDELKEEIKKLKGE